MSLWTIVRFFHVVSAIGWVGGQLALSLVVRPAAADSLDEDGRGPLFVAIGRRFFRISVVALLPLLVATGLALSWHRGVSQSMFLTSSYGVVLSVKVALALGSVVLAVLHGVTVARGGLVSRVIGLGAVVVSIAVVFLATWMAT